MKLLFTCFIAMFAASIEAANIGIAIEPQGPTTGIAYVIVDEPEFSNPYFAKSFEFELEAEPGLQLVGLESGILPKLFPFTIPTLSGTENLVKVEATSPVEQFVGGSQTLAAVRYTGSIAGNFAIGLKSFAVRQSNGAAIPIALESGTNELELPGGQVIVFARSAVASIVPEPSVLVSGLLAAMTALLRLRRR